MSTGRSAIGLLLCVWLLGCGGRDRDDVTLLFFRRSPVAGVGNTTWAPDAGASRIIVFRGVHPLRSLTGAATTPVAAVPLGPYVLVSELTGEGVVLDTAGRLVREWASPHPAAIYAASGDRVVAARSPYRVPAFLTEPLSAPLIKVLDTLGRPVDGFATVTAGPLMTQAENAGAIAAAGDAVYFAPLTLNEIRKFDRGGTLIWTTRRDSTAVDSRDVDALHPRVVNIALTVGPNGRLYALGVDDADTSGTRIDVLDSATGRILASRRLGPRETAVALGANDSIVAFDADSLAALLATEGREPFGPAVTLATPAGDTVRVPADHDGYVRLVNFWASWCDPCKEEFPHMGELVRAFAGDRFVVLAISDDVDRAAMQDFLQRYDPGNLVILAGRGRMKALYHYRGLPYSVLIDRRGRVVERIFGFGGERAFARLRQTIAIEIASP